MTDGPKVQDRTELEGLIEAGSSLSGLDASGVDLSGMDLSGQDLSYAKLRYTDLSKANLRRINLSHANMRHCRLQQADLRFADLRGADLSHSSFHECILGQTDMEGAVADGAEGVRGEVFFPRSLLENLVGQPGVYWEDNELEIENDSVGAYRMSTAFRLVELQGGAGDEKLAGQVLTEEEIRRRSGKLEDGYLVLKKGTYSVEPGYLGVPMPREKGAQPGTVPDDTSIQDGDKTDMDMLEDFLLNKLK